MLICFRAAALQPHLLGTRVAAAVAHTAFSMVGHLGAMPHGDSVFRPIAASLTPALPTPALPTPAHPSPARLSVRKLDVAVAWWGWATTGC